MAAAGVKRFVFSSTCATFGEPQTTPIDETHPQRPINAYGETKLAIERALPHVERATGIASVALRYFNAAGADPDGADRRGPRSGRAPDSAARFAAARGGRPLTVFGDDYPTRPTARASATTCTSRTWPTPTSPRSKRLEAGGASGAYNLGNGNGHVGAAGHRRGRSRRRVARAAQRWRRDGPGIRRGSSPRTNAPAPSSAGRPRYATLDDHRRHGVAVAQGARRTGYRVSRDSSERVPADLLQLRQPYQGRIGARARRDGGLRRGLVSAWWR